MSNLPLGRFAYCRSQNQIVWGLKNIYVVSRGFLKFHSFTLHSNSPFFLSPFKFQNKDAKLNISNSQINISKTYLPSHLIFKNTLHMYPIPPPDTTNRSSGTWCHDNHTSINCNQVSYTIFFTHNFLPDWWLVLAMSDPNFGPIWGKMSYFWLYRLFFFRLCYFPYGICLIFGENWIFISSSYTIYWLLSIWS